MNDMFQMPDKLEIELRELAKNRIWRKLIYCKTIVGLLMAKIEFIETSRKFIVPIIIINLAHCANVISV